MSTPDRSALECTETAEAELDDGYECWHIGYELLDSDQDGMTDTLRVVRIRHAASSPTDPD